MSSVWPFICSCQVAIEVLTDTSGTKKGMPKQAFLDRLAESLTAAEQVRQLQLQRAAAQAVESSRASAPPRLT